MIVDYFIIKDQSFELLALYKDDAGYPAWHIPAFIAFLVPVALTITSIIVGEGAFYDWFYSYGWFTGSTLGGLIYWLVSRGK